MRKTNIFRGVAYLIGMVVFAFGVTLNTRTGLGASPIMSIPFSVSVIWNGEFGVMIFFYYCICTALQSLIGPRHCTLRSLLSQIPLALAVGSLVVLFDHMLPPKLSWFPAQMVLLVIASLCVGVGGALAASMSLAACPTDALAEVLGKALGKNTLFWKNVLELSGVIVTAAIGYVMVGHIVGMQIGTLLCVFFTRRLAGLFNRFFKAPLRRMAGLESLPKAAETPFVGEITFDDPVISSDLIDPSAD